MDLSLLLFLEFSSWCLATFSCCLHWKINGDSVIAWLKSYLFWPGNNEKLSHSISIFCIPFFSYAWSSRWVSLPTYYDRTSLLPGYVFLFLLMSILVISFIWAIFSDYADLFVNESYITRYFLCLYSLSANSYALSAIFTSLLILISFLLS